jgi:RNA polymerase sigma factor (sigma-70 family)
METDSGLPIAPELVSLARGGDDAARAQLYGALAGSVYTLARRILGTDALAEDVLQDTFVDVFTKLSELRDDAAIGAWTRRIAVNRALSHLRSSWVVRRVDWSVEEFQELPSTQAGLDDTARLEAALDALPDAARAVVWLYDVEGYTHREIAGLMGRSVSFSKTRLARAHEILRTLLGHADETGESEAVSEGKELCVGELKTI